MTWLTRLLIGFGLVVALLVSLVVIARNWGPGVPPRQTVEMSFGNRLVTVKGHYKNLTQESMADGLMIGVDGHNITVGDDQITLDGTVQVLDPGQNIEVVVDESGVVKVRLEGPAADSAGAPSE